MIADCLDSLLEALPRSTEKTNDTRTSPMNIELANRAMLGKDG